MEPEPYTGQERRKRGRPAKGVPVAQSWVSTKLVEADHDRLIRLAARRRDSVAAMVRTAIRALLAHHAA